jgi:hypothetical protein
MPYLNILNIKTLLVSNSCKVVRFRTHAVHFSNFERPACKVVNTVWKYLY